jgi:CIC family chloride channel protein
VFIAVTIGIGAGLASVGFHELIDWVKYIFLTRMGGALQSSIGPFGPIVMLGTGGLIVGLIIKYLSAEVKGHGIPEVMYAVAFKGGDIPIRTSVYRALAAAVCIGSGGSGGPEGPIVQIGAGVGSELGRQFRLNDRRIILCVGCGAAAGIAATFNAPIAGVIFALEVVLARFTATSFSIIVLSSITATVFQRWITGNNTPSFEITQAYALTSSWELPLFALMGVLGAVVAHIFMRTLLTVELATDRIRVPEVLKPAIGGALVGVIGIFTQDVFSTGYSTIEKTFSGGFAVSALLSLCLLKIVATSLTVGSGGSAGVFAPSLFIGATFGGLFGGIAHAVFPSFTSEQGAYAIVGMAAVFAASAHAPMTGVLMVFEMTGNYQLILPLMAASVLGVFVSQQIGPDSIYTMKLTKRGVNIRSVQDIDLMDSITVGDAMERKVEAIPRATPLTALILKFASREHNGYPVTDDNGLLYGIVTMTDVNNAVIDKNPDLVTVGEICQRNVYVIRPDQSLSTALTQFGAHNVARLPVVDPHNPGKLVGMLGPADIVKAYVGAYGKTQEQLRKVDRIHTLRETSGATIEQETIRSGSKLAGKLVKDAHFPPGSTIVSITRGHETIVPHGSTEFHYGDVLMVLTSRENAPELRKWLRGHC